MRRDSRQLPLFPVTSFFKHPYPRGSLYDLLARFGEFLFRRSDFPEAEAALGGETGWCPVVLSKLELLRQKHSWTDREAVNRATYDLQVKACLGLGLEQHGPSQTTLCRHRLQMQELKLDEVAMHRLRDLLEALELVGDEEPVLIDSVPVHGGGQQLDTYGLLAAATLRGLRELAKRAGRPVETVAGELDLGVYLHRSVKGRFGVDWEDAGSRHGFLARLVADALTVRRLLDGQKSAESSKPERADDSDDAGGGTESSAAGTIDAIIEHDIEFDGDGAVKGIVQKRAGDRVISVTDPEMRHGRKSASKLFAGYKAQIVTSLLYGFIVVVRVIRANVHDGHDLPAIARSLHERGTTPAWWGGDHAYGTLANHQFFADDERGDLVSRMARPSNGGRFTKDEFDYNFDSHTLVCPAGVSLARFRWTTHNKKRCREFEYPGKSCGACPLRAQCINPKAGSDKGRTVRIVDTEERLIREHLARRETQEFKDRLSRRPAVERVISGFAQCGGKKTRRHGQTRVSFASNLSALAYNLRRLGSLMQADESLAARLDQALRAFARRVCRIVAGWCSRVAALAWGGPRQPSCA